MRSLGTATTPETAHLKISSLLANRDKVVKIVAHARLALCSKSHFTCNTYTVKGGDSGS